MAIGPKILQYIQYIVYHLDTPDSACSASTSRRQHVRTILVHTLIFASVEYPIPYPSRRTLLYPVVSARAPSVVCISCAQTEVSIYLHSIPYHLCL